MSSTFVSVGTPVALKSDPSGSDSTPALTVRCGDRFVALDQCSAGVWACAGQPARGEDLATTPHQRAALDELVQNGLMVCFADDLGQASDAVLDLVPVPLSIGLGPSTEDPVRVAIADRTGTILVRVGVADYVIWSHLDGRTSIRYAITRSAAELRCDPAELVPRIPALFAALLTSGAVGLDVG